MSVLRLLLSSLLLSTAPWAKETRCDATRISGATVFIVSRSATFSRTPLWSTTTSMRGGATTEDKNLTTHFTDVDDDDGAAGVEDVSSPTATVEEKNEEEKEKNANADAIDVEKDKDEEEKNETVSSSSTNRTATKMTRATMAISPDDPEAIFLETDESEGDENSDDDEDDTDDAFENEDDVDVVITTHEARVGDGERAVALRAEGRRLHDGGRFPEAADAYGAAADAFAGGDDADTCRSHEALCALKAGDHARCARACDSLVRDSPSAAVQARARHRRARARLASGDREGALEDARAAAFSGDRGAVALYGRLLRGDDDDERGGEATSSSLSDPFAGLAGEGPSALGGGGALSDIAASFLSGKGGDVADVAGSLVSTLAERVQSPETQETVCRFLNNVSGERVTSLAEAANVPLTSKQIDRLVRVAKGVTPKKLDRGVRLARRAVTTVRVVRKVAKVVGKYRHLLVYALMLQWIKSAVRRPVVVRSVKSRTATG